MSKDGQLDSVDVEKNPEYQHASKRSKLRLGAVLVALYLSLFVAALDQTIISTALPTIASDLNSSAGVVWIGGAYLLADAAAAPIWGKLSDIWGRKLILLIGVALFFGSSVLCALAQSLQVLIAGRALQGVAGAALIQVVTIIVSDLFSLRHRGIFLAGTEAIWALAGGVGPVIGGAFAQRLSWRWCFWINLPLAGVAFVFLLLFLDVHDPKTRTQEGLKAVDWFGSTAILGLVLMVLLGLQFGGREYAWNSPQVVCLLVFGTASLIVFVYIEKKIAKYPIIPLGLFEDPSNVACMVICFTHGMIFIAAEYYLPLYFQAVKHASPLFSGVLTVPIIFTEALMGVLCGIYINKTGRYREIIWFGTILMTISSLLYISFALQTSIAVMIIIVTFGGIGAGLLFIAPLIALQATVSQDDTATATATFGFIRNLASALSVVIGGVIFQSQIDIRLPRLNVSSDIVEVFTKGEAAAHVDRISKIMNVEQQTLVKEAFAWSLRRMWIVYVCIAFVAVLASFFVKKEFLSTEHVETKTGLPLSDSGSDSEM